MHTHNRWYSILFFVLFLIGCNNVIPKETDIYVFAVVDDSFVGDRDQILGVCNSICQFKPKAKIIKFSITDSEKSIMDVCGKLELEINKTDISKNAKFFLISSGNYGVSLIKYLKTMRSKFNKLVTCYATHQLSKKNVDLINISDFMVVPNHVIDAVVEDKFKKSLTHLISTIGVSHNTTEEMILTDYEKEKNKITAKFPYIVVVLGGDAPQPNGVMCYYTAKEAEKLADLISVKSKNDNLGVLILNGPRTGKFDQKTGKPNLGVHEENGIIDLVTYTFVKRLEENGLKDGIDFNLFDFKFKQPSMKMAVYGALKKMGGFVFVAGESTSMVSEMTSLFEPNQVIIYKHGAMNENHMKHVQSEFQNNRANVLNEDLTFNYVKGECKVKLSESVATTIAKTILSVK